MEILSIITIIILLHFLYVVDSAKYFTGMIDTANFNIMTRDTTDKMASTLVQLNKPPPNTTVLLINVGSAISMKFDYSNPINLQTNVGEIFDNEIFSVFENRYLFNRKRDDYIGTTQNCDGSPLMVDSIWYNIKFRSPEEAFAKNGIFISRHQVLISNTENKNFSRCAPYLERLIKKGSQVEAKAADCVNFWFPVNVNHYYLYAGRYKANVNGQQYDQYTNNMTFVLPLNKAKSISHSQFSYFQNIESCPPRFGQKDVEVFYYTGKIGGT